MIKNLRRRRVECCRITKNTKESVNSHEMEYSRIVIQNKQNIPQIES